MRRPRLGLASWILIGVLLGAGTGLLLGEYAAGLAVVGDAFVSLLQMTVLPYITFSLIANIGGLPAGNSRRLAVAAASFLLVSYATSLAAVVLIPLVLPPLESASFFSSAVLSPPAQLDFIELFIPANPFHALANNIVPAVVLFCISVGAALITLPNRQEIVGTLNLLTEALGRVNSVLVKLTPLGVFAITASTAGTMELAEFERLQVYLLIYTIAVALLGLVVLPGLLASLSPFSYRDILRALRVPLITAFATGKVFIVLPMLVEQTEKLFADLAGQDEERRRVIRAVTPLVYPFPHAGKLMALLFIPFTAWFIDQPLGLLQYPAFLGAGLLSFFGSPVAAMPFLLDLHRLPSDMFQLFLVSGVYASRLGDALGAIHILFVAVLTTAAMSGLLKWRPRRLLGWLLLTTALWGLTLVGTRTYLSHSIRDTYTADKLVMGMHAAVASGPATIHRQAPPYDEELAALPILQRLQRTGVLRVGYHPRNLPFSFFNETGDLVGLDIDMAHRLAADLECALEFVPADWDRSQQELEAGVYDILMTGSIILPDYLQDTLFSDAYMAITAALIVRDHRRDETVDRARRRDFAGFRVGVTRVAADRPMFNHLLPGVTMVPIATLPAYLEGTADDVDAVIWAAETGSAWTLLYPAFSVVPLEPLYQVPVAYPLARGQLEFAELLNAWLKLMETTGEVKRLHDYWILGENATAASPRWSVIRDVLGWVE